MNILEILTAVASSSGGAKLTELKKHEDNALLKQIIYLTLSPRIKFFIKKLPDFTSIGDKDTLDEIVYFQLPRIYTREITGDQAKAVLSECFARLKSDDVEVLKRIIDSNLLIGCNKSTVNKVWPKLIETIPYMGAKPYNVKAIDRVFKSGNPVFGQIKMDGQYTNVIIDEESVVMESRSGESCQLSLFADKIAELAAQDHINCGIVLNGELTISGIDRYTSNGIISAMVSLDKKIQDGEVTDAKLKAFEVEHGMSMDEMQDRVVLTVWDYITIAKYTAGSCTTKYAYRFANLNEVIDFTKTDNVQLIESVILDTKEEAMAYFTKAINNGEEGIIVKTMDGTWKDGKPWWQVKMKLVFDCDLRIVGFKQGKARTKYANTLGSFICESADGLVTADPGGIADAVRDEVWNNKERYIDTIISTTSCGVSQDRFGGYSLLHPRFDGFRPDKLVADTLQQIVAAEEMVKSL